MKLWIFNVLVAGALAYLFLGESEQSRVKSDLEWAKDKVETSIDKNRSGDDVEADRTEARQQPAMRRESRAEAITEPEQSAPVDRKSAERSAPRPESEPKPVIEQPTETHDASVARQIESNPPRTVENPVSAVAVEPLEAPRAAMVEEQPSGDKEISRGETVPLGGARPREGVREGLPPLGDPEVARRRAVVLNIDDASPPADTAEGEATIVHVTAMAARERRDALNALAEDMELMFADKTAH